MLPRGIDSIHEDRRKADKDYIAAINNAEYFWWQQMEEAGRKMAEDIDRRMDEEKGISSDAT